MLKRATTVEAGPSHRVGIASVCASALVALACVAGVPAVSAQPGPRSERIELPPLPSPPRPPARANQPQVNQPRAPRSDTAEATPLRQALDRPGDLTLQGSSLKGALYTIGEQWRINIVAGEVEGAVNGVFRNAPLREILDSILLSNGYGYRAVGDSLVISRLSELGQVNPFFVSATIPIAAADVNEVVQGASLLSTPAGQVRAIPSARAVVVLDFADRVQKIREFIASIDEATLKAYQGSSAAPINRPLEVAYLKTHHVKAEDMMTLLEAVLSTDGKVSVMKREDRLLVVDYAENLRMVRQVVQHADRPRPQVAIQALIYDISLQDLEECGLNWHSLSNGDFSGTAISGGGSVTGTPTLGSGVGSFINSVTKVPFADGSAGGAFTLYSLNSSFSMAAVVMALQNAADSRLLASPNITVLENEQASIQSIQEIPFQQLTQTAAGGNIGTTAFKEAGITLNVTPKIGADGVIEMQVRPEFSRLTGFTPGDNQPIIDKRVATTNVRVSNGETFVLGGLRQRTDVGDFKGIPLLKDVRIIGPLFRSRETDIRESELMVFVRPTIVGACGELCGRERRAADTVDCRLDRIPVPEGCPPSLCEAGATPCEGAPTVDTDTPPETVPTPGVAAPVSQDEDLPAPPMYQDAPPAAEPSVGQIDYPELSQNPTVRRLPPPPGEGIAPLVTAPAGQSFVGGMRPGYNDRYHSSRDQSPAQPPVEQAKKPRGFWSLFR